jgi:metal-responsive CopG/Arc/MetJ family transcriptional regulator
MKVMVSIPDDLLERIDRGAAERGESRSAFLQEAARMRLGEPDPELTEALAEMQELCRGIPADIPPAHVLIRQDRDSR